MSPLKLTLIVSAVSALTVVAACAAWICWDIAKGWGKP